MKDANLTVKTSKCSWCFTRFDFLGFCVGEGSLSIPAARVGQLRNYVRTSNKSHLRSFLGLCNFYARFIPHFSSIVAPLNSLLQRNSPDALPWNNNHDLSFQSVLSAICDHSSLVIPCNNVFSRTPLPLGLEVVYVSPGTRYEHRVHSFPESSFPGRDASRPLNLRP